MSNREKHVENANQALYQARRFITAAQSPKADNHAKISQASTARSFADMAVAEAAHARDAMNLIGPTELQMEASKVSDEAIKLFQYIVHNVCRQLER